MSAAYDDQNNLEENFPNFFADTEKFSKCFHAIKVTGDKILKRCISQPTAFVHNEVAIV